MSAFPVDMKQGKVIVCTYLVAIVVFAGAKQFEEVQITNNDGKFPRV